MINNIIKLKKYLQEVLELGITPSDLYYMYGLEQHNFVITETAKNTSIRNHINAIISDIYESFSTFKNSYKETLLDIVYMPKDEIEDFQLPLAYEQVDKLLSEELRIFHKTSSSLHLFKKNERYKTTHPVKTYAFSTNQKVLQSQQKINKYASPEKDYLPSKLADAA